MDKKEFKYIEVQYKLYTINGDVRELEEETNDGLPFAFISGFGATIPGFENNIAKLSAGDEFDFIIEKEDAYGDYYDERVINLDKNVFCINGKFDSQNIYVDAIVPLQNEDGNRFMGHVLEINDSKVKIDLNHPLAGKSLNFAGKVVTSREATTEEIQQMISRLAGGGCGGCGGGNCGGNCGDGECNCNK